MRRHENPCFKCFTRNHVIPKVDDDPRDTLMYRKEKLSENAKRALKEYRSRRSEYWSDLAKPKRIRTPVGKPTVPQAKENTVKKTWSVARMNELSRPRFDYYEYTQEIVISRRSFRHVDHERINDLATPRKTSSSTSRSQKSNHKVNLSTLLPSIERLSIAPRRTDPNEHVKTDQDAFSVKKSALKYVATERLKRLATPRRVYQED